MDSADLVDLSLCFALAVLKARPQKLCLFDALYTLVTGDSALGISPIPYRHLESPHVSILCVPQLRLWQEVSVLFGRTQSLCLPNGILVRVGGGAGSCSEDSLGLPRKQFLVSLVSSVWYIKEISPHSSGRVFLYSYIQQLNPFSYRQPCTRDLCSQEMGPISFPALACPRNAPLAVLLVWLTLPVPIHTELHHTDMRAALSSAPRSVRLTDKAGCVGMLPLLFMFSYGVGYTSVRKTFQIGQNNWHNWLTIWLYHIFFWHFDQN